MIRIPPRRIVRSILSGVAIVLLAGCASARGPAAPGDPLEGLNRNVYAFNDAFDRAVGRPVARAYVKVVPRPVDRSVTNFFNNLDDVLVLLNSTAQLKGRKMATTSFRLLFNTTFGIFGLFDVAGGVGVPKENEDFGQTLGYWGIGTGPYLVLPFLGPSDLRDTGGLWVDGRHDPLYDITSNQTETYSTIGLRAIDTRASLLSATDVLDTAAVDPYSFTREAYLRRRANQVYDGNPPPEAMPGDQGTDGEDAFDPFGNEDDDLFKDNGGSADEPPKDPAD